MPCKACRNRVKDWNGDNPKCAFQSGPFSDANWNCATANLVRDFLEGIQDGSVIIEGVSVTGLGDQSHAILSVDDGSALYVSWYKSRGCTERMLLISDSQHIPIEAEVLEVLRGFKIPETTSAPPRPPMPGERWEGR